MGNKIYTKAEREKIRALSDSDLRLFIEEMAESGPEAARNMLAIIPPSEFWTGMPPGKN